MSVVCSRIISSAAACAAARRAINTRYGEHETYVKPFLWQNLIDSGSPPCSPQIPNLIFGRTLRPFVAAISINWPTPLWS